MEKPTNFMAFLGPLRIRPSLMSVPPHFYRRHLDEAEATEWIVALNKGILEAIGEEPRLKALAYLPLEHPSLAAWQSRRRLPVAGNAAWRLALPDGQLRPLAGRYPGQDRERLAALGRPAAEPPAPASDGGREVGEPDAVA
jgi:aminocarboxymuconate-semialdehyde decarboxylase